jgi:hypothetical protein
MLVADWRHSFEAVPLLQLRRLDRAEQDAVLPQAVGRMPQRQPVRRRQWRRLERPGLLLQEVDKALHLSKARLLLVSLGLLQRLLALDCLLSLHLVVVELGKIVDNDGDGQGHHQHPRDGAAGADKLAQTGLGADVSVADCGHGDDGPPEGGRYGGESLRGTRQ